MVHLIEAWQTLWQKKNKENPSTVSALMGCIEINGNKLGIHIQDGTIPDVGINGIQVTDLLEYVNEVYISLNNAYPCKENAETIQYIQNALTSQYNRTKDRTARGVEGKYEK